MKIKYCIVVLLLNLSSLGFAMQRITLNEAAIAQLKPIPRNGLFGEKRLDIVDVEMLEQPERTFVGKLNLYNQYVRYFLVKNNQGVEALVHYARNKATWDPDFFYCDGLREKAATSIAVIRDTE